MRVGPVLLVALALLGCGPASPREATRGRDASVETEPAASFVPYAPPAAFPLPTGAAGTAWGGGFAGSGGTVAGGAGAGGSAPPPLPPPSFCDGMAQRPLPYPIAAEFSSRFVLNSGSFLEVPFPDCDQTSFPDLGGAPDGDASADADTDLESLTSCESFKYDPDACVAEATSSGQDPGASCWAGVIFTPGPVGLGGPPICIAPGARAIHFRARASRDDARVKFGSIREGLGATEFYLHVTRDWQPYTITIPEGEDYDAASAQGPGGVWNAFSVIAEPQDHAGGTYIFVADVVWDRN